MKVHQGLGGVEIAFRFQALNLAQELAKKLAQLLVIIDLKVGFSLAVEALNDLLRKAFFKGPCSHHLAISHMSFFNFFSQFKTGKLDH